MSLHFIIDGYNLIKQTPILNKARLEDSRLALIRFLTIHRPQGRNRVTVVFDGKEGNFCSRPVSSVGIIFTQGESADDKIKELTENSKSPKNMVVVTNDREIQVFVRRLKAQVRTVEEFLLKFNGSSRINSKTEDKVILSPADTAKITEEMKNVWLK